MQLRKDNSDSGEYSTYEIEEGYNGSGHYLDIPVQRKEPMKDLNKSDEDWDDGVAMVEGFRIKKTWFSWHNTEVREYDVDVAEI